MMANEDSFTAFVLSRVEPGRPFVPQVHYDRDGDCIEFLTSDDPFYGERIDSLVTVYYSEETKQIVGSLIKGVKHFIQDIIKKVPGFRIEVEDGRIRLEHIFTARLWYVDPQKECPGIVLTYRKLRDVAEKVAAEADLESSTV